MGRSSSATDGGWAMPSRSMPTGSTTMPSANSAMAAWRRRGSCTRRPSSWIPAMVGPTSAFPGSPSGGGTLPMPRSASGWAYPTPSVDRRGPVGPSLATTVPTPSSCRHWAVWKSVSAIWPKPRLCTWKRPSRDHLTRRHGYLSPSFGRANFDRVPGLAEPAIRPPSSSCRKPAFGRRHLFTQPGPQWSTKRPAMSDVLVNCSRRLWTLIPSAQRRGYSSVVWRPTRRTGSEPRNALNLRSRMTDGMHGSFRHMRSWRPSDRMAAAELQLSCLSALSR
mmetsp:Transcript_2164/g.6293  ORF Transcript_2164/g.6293 Transcript_2164/m.6293 type:complete len:278 (+) Transcript_2164:1257-2090(+)